ncbi:MAG: hypothetical protein NVSMB64_23030 [Candidatus Velthaea sp.]
MNVRRRQACAALGLVLAVLPLRAEARASIDLRADRLNFFSDLPGIVARAHVRITTGTGIELRGESAYLDLHANRFVIAGGVLATNGTIRISADAIAVDLQAGRLDVLRAASGAERLDATLQSPVAEEIEPDRFAFPDLDDARAYIRARRASITPHANARFMPAAFPNSPGAVPVPSYLYTFATNPNFGTSALGGATFDQPYGLSGGTTSLLAAHFRYEDGIGATIGLDDHRVYGDNAYILTALDSPLRPNRSAVLQAYQRMGSRFSHTLDASSAFGYSSAHYALTGAFAGGSGARLDIGRTSRFTSADVNAHTPDRRIVGAVTARLNADIGFESIPGGVLSVLPDARSYGTLWHHGADLFFFAPAFGGPLGSSLATTLRLSRTWYAFPHQRDNAALGVSASRDLLKNVRLYAVYTAAYAYDIFPTAQARFYPRFASTFIAPDGTPWPGFSAYTGASSQRGVNVDLTYSRADTSVRLALAQADDFPQFHGYGRAPYSVRVDGRFRPLPNIGLAFGRSYGFGWGGQRFSRWTFAVLP